MASPTTRESRVAASAYKVIHKGHPWFHRLYYRLVTRLFAGELLLLNNGYEEDPPMDLPLAASDEPHRFQIQLYHATATQVDLSGKQVLEVSCGHGGGASYLVRTLHPASYTGLDLNPDGIAFCRDRHHLPELDFVQGDAQNLPFPDESFDAVINIEAASLYPDFPRFLAEVARVLRPGGHFLYEDFPHPMGVPAWEAALADAPMRMVSERRISAEIARGLEKNSHHLLGALDHRTPKFLHGPLHKFFGATIKSASRDLQSGARTDSYRLYCFVKE
jgi:SAM-dependent methyltransferase